MPTGMAFWGFLTSSPGSSRCQLVREPEQEVSHPLYDHTKVHAPQGSACPSCDRAGPWVTPATQPQPERVFLTSLSQVS